MELNEGETFVIFVMGAPFNREYHIVLDGGAVTLCGKQFDSTGRWWIAESDGDWRQFCKQCLSELEAQVKA